MTSQQSWYGAVGFFNIKIRLLSCLCKKFLDLSLLLAYVMLYTHGVQPLAISFHLHKCYHCIFLGLSFTTVRKFCRND